MADEILTDKIDDWLKGKMASAEAATFQAAIDADHSLAEEVELHRITLQAMDHLSEKKLQQNILTWMDVSEQIRDNSPNRLKNAWLITIAALLVILLGSLVYQFYQQKKLKAEISTIASQLQTQDSLLKVLFQEPKSNPTLKENLQQEKLPIKKPNGVFAFYKKPDDWVMPVRSITGDGPKATPYLIEGVSFFRKSNLVKAEEKARESLKHDPENRDALRLLAHSLFGQERFVESASEFTRLQEAFSSFSKEAYEAEWNRLLCYRALSADSQYKLLYETLLIQILGDPKHTFFKDAKGLKGEKL